MIAVTLLLVAFISFRHTFLQCGIRLDTIWDFGSGIFILIAILLSHTEVLE